MTIYKSTHTKSGETRLVEATNQAQVRAFVSRDEYEIEVPSMKEYGELLMAGHELETIPAKNDPAVVVDTKSAPLPLE